MNLILSFLPVIAFLLTDDRLGARSALLIATATGIAILLFRVLIRRETAKALEIGSTAVFALLSMFVLVSGDGLRLPVIRLLVDIGLIAVIVVSIAVGRPFTLQYVSGPDRPGGATPDPVRLHAHNLVSAVWAGVFVLHGLIDLVWIEEPHMKPVVPLLVSGLVALAALRFSRWYPGHLRRQAGPSPERSF